MQLSLRETLAHELGHIRVGTMLGYAFDYLRLDQGAIDRGGHPELAAQQRGPLSGLTRFSNMRSAPPRDGATVSLAGVASELLCSTLASTFANAATRFSWTPNLTDLHAARTMLGVCGFEPELTACYEIGLAHLRPALSDIATLVASFDSPDRRLTELAWIAAPKSRPLDRTARLVVRPFSARDLSRQRATHANLAP